MTADTPHAITLMTQRQITGLQQQIAGLLAERAAARQQIAGLVAERDSLRAQLDELAGVVAGFWDAQDDGK